jgi:D-3-phosphoglycerate dehydrogenase
MQLPSASCHRKNYNLRKYNESQWQCQFQKKFKNPEPPACRQAGGSGFISYLFLPVGRQVPATFPKLVSFLKTRRGFSLASGLVSFCLFICFFWYLSGSLQHIMHPNSIKILHIDSNHPLLLEQLQQAGFTNHEDYKSTKEEIEAKIQDYTGIVIRSRFKIDKTFIDKATNLKFIARVGAGLESIDCDYATSKNIHLIAAPEGNRNAVGEHTLGMLLSLFNKLNRADKLVREGNWIREGNRGYELEGKTVGIIGYGNMGKSFAKKIKGFDVTVLCYDIQENVGDENAQQVSLQELQQKADVISLHIPWTPETDKMVETKFINSFAKPFWLLNTSRGKNVITADIVDALKSGKILGAGLDVLEYEKLSFENLFLDSEKPAAFQYLLDSENVILTPHIAGWTFESHEKLAQTIVDKIKAYF